MRTGLAAVLFLCVAGGSAIAADVWEAAPSQTPEQSARRVQAHFDAFAGGQWDNGSGGAAYLLYGAAARANLALGHSLNLQGDVQGAWVADYLGTGITIHDVGGFAHLYARDPGSHAIGVFGGFDKIGDLGDGWSSWTAGVEGQLYLDRHTLYGQVFYSELGNNIDGNWLGVRGQWQFFLTDNTMLSADAIWWRRTLFGNEDNATTLAAAIMHRFADHPVAGFAAVRYDDYRGALYTSFRAMAGVRLFLDSPGSTLMSHLRTGPAMTVISAPWID